MVLPGGTRAVHLGGLPPGCLHRVALAHADGRRDGGGRFLWRADIGTPPAYGAAGRPPPKPRAGAAPPPPPPPPSPSEPFRVVFLARGAAHEADALGGGGRIGAAVHLAVPLAGAPRAPGRAAG